MAVLDESEGCYTVVSALKGLCHEIFNIFFLYQKPLPGLYMNRQKRFRVIFCFCGDIREKTFVHVVVGYANTW